MTERQNAEYGPFDVVRVSDGATFLIGAKTADEAWGWIRRTFLTLIGYRLSDRAHIDSSGAPHG